MLGIGVRPSSLQETSTLHADVRRQRYVIAREDIHGDKDALVRAPQLANLADQDDGVT